MSFWAQTQVRLTLESQFLNSLATQPDSDPTIPSGATSGAKSAASGPLTFWAREITDSTYQMTVQVVPAIAKTAARGRLKSLDFDRVERLLEARLRLDADEAFDDFAVLEDHQRGDAADAVVLGGAGCFVDIELADFDRTVVLAGELFDDGGDLAAWTAPRRPEIDEHRLSARLLDHILHEGLCRGVLYEIFRGLSRRPAIRQHRPFLAPQQVRFHDRTMLQIQHI
jgi:hypothetical protein